jgi:hypothetical protein
MAESSQLSPLLEFLRLAATQLTENGAVWHPSFVAVTKYDVNRDTNRYVAVSGDWLPEYYHYAFPLKQWKHRYERFLSRVQKVRDRYPAVVNADWNETRKWSHCDVFAKVRREIKELEFHMAFTGEIFATAVRDGDCKGCRELEALTNWRASERMEVERRCKKLGHWDYGIALEEFYLNGSECPVYSEIFFQDSSAGNVYALTAFCSDTQAGTKVYRHVPDVSKYGFVPLDVASWRPVIQRCELVTRRRYIKDCLEIPSESQKYKKVEDHLTWLRDTAGIAEIDRIAEALDLYDGKDKIPPSVWAEVFKNVRQSE